jgi:uncharacterized OB-fold protein
MSSLVAMVDTASGTAAARPRIPAVAGWFDPEESTPALLGGRCPRCGTYTFPRATTWCPNPRCDAGEASEVRLSRTGTIWSFTDARYKPPPPYVPVTDPHEPFAIVAVELAAEKMVVLGQVVPGVPVSDLRLGMPVELVVDVLFADDEADRLVWKWRPTAAPATTEGTAGRTTEEGQAAR